jgi:hypothetical protein
MALHIFSIIYCCGTAMIALCIKQLLNNKTAVDIARFMSYKKPASHLATELEMEKTEKILFNM